MDSNDQNSLNKNILITGGLGYIGSHTIVEILSKEFLASINVKDNYRITIVDDCSNSSENILEKIYEITRIEDKNIISLHNVDIVNFEKLEQVFQKNKFYAVIHFAGKKSVNESQLKPLYYYQNNVNGSMNLIELCLKYNVNNFIFSSTACVYGNRDDDCFEEDDDLKPINTYGKSKLMVEKILIDVCRANKNFKSVILRYANPVAAHKSGKIGECPKGVPANLFPVIERHIREKTDKIFIFGNDYNTEDGTCIRDYVHVSDISQGHVLALQCFNSEKANLFTNSSVIYNMGTNSGYSVLNVVNTYKQANPEARLNFEIAGRRDGDAAKSAPNSDKIAKELGWKPSTNLAEMCNDSYNFIIKN